MFWLSAARAFGLRLRGKAWILRDSYQVARLESDLADEIPELRLAATSGHRSIAPSISMKARLRSGYHRLAMSIWIFAVIDFTVGSFTDFQLSQYKYSKLRRS